MYYIIYIECIIERLADLFILWEKAKTAGYSLNILMNAIK